jgi:PKD repeat protein
MAEEPEHVRIDMTQNDSVEDLTLKDDSTLKEDSIMKVTSMETIELGLSPKEESSTIETTSTEVVVVDNQDTNQKIGVAATVAVEFYRALVASFLILFVPQDCGGHVCSFSENAQTGPDPLYNAGFAFNCITMAAFAILYYAEVRREGKLIAYLDVNPAKPSDNAAVGVVLGELPKYCSEAILYYDSLYIKAGYTVIVCFAVNTVLSGLVVYKYYLDDKTTTTYITSVLFVIQKLIQVYATLKTEKNVFYSAYLSGKIQYNDVDKDKMERIGSV